MSILNTLPGGATEDDGEHQSSRQGHRPCKCAPNSPGGATEYRQGHRPCKCGPPNNLYHHIAVFFKWTYKIKETRGETLRLTPCRVILKHLKKGVRLKRMTLKSPDSCDSLFRASFSTCYFGKKFGEMRGNLPCGENFPPNYPQFLSSDKCLPLVLVVPFAAVAREESVLRCDVAAQAQGGFRLFHQRVQLHVEDACVGLIIVLFHIDVLLFII